MILTLGLLLMFCVDVILLMASDWWADYLWYGVRRRKIYFHRDERLYRREGYGSIELSISFSIEIGDGVEMEM